MAVSIGPKIGIEGEAEYRKQINSIIQETKTLKSEYESVTSAFDKGKQSLSQNEEMHRILGEEISAQKGRIEQLKDMVQQASDKFGDADPKTLKWKEALNKANAELAQMQRDIQDLPSNIQLIGEKMEAAGKKIGDAGKKIEDWGRNLTPLSAIASGILAGSTKEFIDFETAMAGVQKTNNELIDSNGNIIISYDDLAEAVKQMSTETASSKEEIAGVMEAAGQLGVGTEYLEDFTRTMIMLGDSTNLSADEAASALAKFANVTGMSLSDVDKLGSVVVDLGNNFATTEQDIVNMATRLSGAGHQIGLTDAQIMGFATALSSVGIEAEMGGSAFSKAMIKMQVAAETGYEPVAELSEKTGMSLRELELLSVNNSKDFRGLADSLGLTATEMKATITAGTNLEDFAKVANMTTEDFVELYRDDAPAALQAFISGLGDTEAHGETTIAMLQDMGFTEVRLRDTLTRLASSGDLVTQAVDKGTEAWKQNTALTTEAEKKYGTTAAQLQQTKEKVTNVALEIGERMLPYLDKILVTVDDLITRWDSLGDSQKDAVFNGIAALAVLSPALTAIGQAISSIGAIVSAVGAVLSGGIATVMAGVAGAALAVGSFIQMWDDGWNAISMVLEAIGIAILAVVAVVAGAEIAVAAAVAAAVFAVSQGFIFIHDHWDEVVENFNKKMASLKQWWNDMCNSWRQWWDALCNAVKNTWSGVTSTLLGFFNTLQTRFRNTVDNLQKSFTDFVGRATRWGRDLMDNFIDGIRSMWNRLVDTVSDIADTIADYLGFSEPDKGPLSNFHTYAPDMMKLFAKGIKDNTGLVESQIVKSFDLAGMGGGIATAFQSGTPYAYMPTPNNNNVSIGSTSIVINAHEGQSVQEIAEAVDEIINARLQKAEAVWV